MPIITHTNWKENLNEMELSDGSIVSYIESGNSDGPPLILLHGYGNSSRCWKYSFKFLDDYRIIAIDEMGAGNSSCPDCYAFPISRQADIVVELLEKLGIDRIFLVGHSIGSYIAQNIAFSHPDRVRAAVLVSTFSHMNESQESVRAVENSFSGSVDDFRPGSEWFSENRKYPDQEGFVYLMDDIRKMPANYFRATWRGMLLADHRNFLQFIKAPVMVIWGENDTGINDEAKREFVKYMPTAKMVIYKGVGHEIENTVPELLCRDINNFFSKNAKA